MNTVYYPLYLRQPSSNVRSREWTKASTNRALSRDAERRVAEPLVTEGQAMLSPRDNYTQLSLACQGEDGSAVETTLGSERYVCLCKRIAGLGVELDRRESGASTWPR